MSTSDTEVPTRARFKLAAWLCGLAAILYLDRLCMAQAVTPIQNELGLTNTEISYVSMAFTLAYGAFMVPVGRLADAVGSRAVLTGVVLGWSALTGLTGAASGLAMLMVLRFLFGAAEAGAFPNAARMISRWFPLGERGRIQGIMLASAQMGAVFTPIVAAYVIQLAGWRWMFFSFAAIGGVWALGFWLWYRDDPRLHPSVSPKELAIIHAGSPPTTTAPGPVPWRRVFRNRGILILSLVTVLGAFYTYFFYTWFQKYLNAARGVDNVTTGWLTSVVFAGSAVGMLIGGWLSDRIPTWTSQPITARRYLGVLSYLTSSACLFAGIQCDNSYALALFWGASFCAMHLSLPNWWSCALPQSGRHVATLFGLMNGMGVMGALVSQGFVGIFADWQKERGLSGRAQWDPLFDVYVLVLIGGAVAWWFYRFTPLEEADAQQ